MKRNLDSKMSIEKRMIKRHKMNRKILGAFLFLVAMLFISKIIESILIDIGIGVFGEVENSWWTNPDYLKPGVPEYVQMMLKTRPHSFWILTQFTWITTIWLLIFLFFRYFEFSENVPSWLRWLLSPRSATLIATYEMIVGIVFWSSLATSFVSGFSPYIYGLQYTNTIVVHAVLPVFSLFYAIWVQITSAKASLLRERYIIKGMIYPIFYSIFYIGIAYTWADPYTLTNFNNDTALSFAKLIIALICVYVLLGILMIIQNALLLKYNRFYNPEKDYAILQRKKIDLIKARESADRKFHRLYPELAEEEYKKITEDIRKETNRQKKMERENKK